MPMPVTFTKTSIDGVLLVKTGMARDGRGYFSEAYSQMMWEKSGFSEPFVQDNVSISAQGTLRGLHYQIEPAGMGKLVRCLSGRIYDVAVDLRRSSATFGQYVGCELSPESGEALWIPSGFAHGFLALDENAIVYYKCTSHHAPEYERSLHYACPTLNIQWPVRPSVVSEKDEAAPLLGDAEYNFA